MRRSEAGISAVPVPVLVVALPVLMVALPVLVVALPVLVVALPVLVVALPVLVVALPVLVVALPVLVVALPVLVVALPVLMVARPGARVLSSMLWGDAIGRCHRASPGCAAFVLNALLLLTDWVCAPTLPGSHSLQGKRAAQVGLAWGTCMVAGRGMAMLLSLQVLH